MIVSCTTVTGAHLYPTNNSDECIFEKLHRDSDLKLTSIRRSQLGRTLGQHQSCSSLCHVRTHAHIFLVACHISHISSNARALARDV